MNHKTHSANESAAPVESRATAASRAAQAAARVAARYASAPSYSEMLAEEARAALRAAEAATKAAQKAHAAAQYVLDGLEAAASAESDWRQQVDSENVPAHQFSADLAQEAQDSPGPMLMGEAEIADRREPEPAKPAPARRKSRRKRAAAVAAAVENRPEPALPALTVTSVDDALIGEVAEPIYANLIQFPREVVATRKVRPRRIEGPLAAAAPTEQLSIFEVDPGTISTQPTSPAADESAAPVWMRPDWSSIELKEQPQEELLEEPEPQAPPMVVHLAPMSQRLLAFVVDASLVVAGFLGVAALSIFYGKTLPGPRALEMGTAVALLVISAGYLWLFFSLAKATPGMRYAGIGLCTFDGRMPSDEQCFKRLKTMVLSVLPLGLGLVWAFFDEPHLTWHDRLSKTYLRKY